MEQPQSNTKEEWKWHPRFQGKYAVSSYGRVALYRYDEIEKKKVHKDTVILVVQNWDRYGNPVIFIYEEDQMRPYLLFVFVLEAFVGDLTKNGNPKDCAIANLRWRP